MTHTSTAMATAIVDRFIGKHLSNRSAKTMIDDVVDAMRRNTQRMLTYGTVEIDRIARDTHTTESTVTAVLKAAGCRCVSESDLATVWSANDTEHRLIDLNAAADEIVTLLHASRDGMRNAGIDTTQVAFDLRRDGGYACEAFGILRALRLLGYGFFGDVNNDDPRNLRRLYAQLENRVLADEHFGNENTCDHCFHRYGKDAIRRG